MQHGFRNPLVLCLVTALGLTSPVFALPPDVIFGDAVVGVDHYGRVKIAVDPHPRDGVADLYFLFTADTRLPGSWSQRVENALIVAQEDTLLLMSTPPGFVVSLALHDAQPQHAVQPPFGSAFSYHSGVELVLSPPDVARNLSDIAIDDRSSWPPSFTYDLLDPASCTNDSDCTQGGSSATACGIFGCPEPPTGCSVTCASPTFACCKCTSAGCASCRCRGCFNPPEIPRVP